MLKDGLVYYNVKTDLLYSFESGSRFSPYDMGTGRGKPITQQVDGGVVGIILDARGREIELPQNDITRREKLSVWLRAMGE